jgi:hypothetical protein
MGPLGASTVHRDWEEVPLGTRFHRWRRAAAVLIAIVALTAVGVSPAAAITDGVPDGTGHPYVGLMIARSSDGDYLWRCSGTLITSTVFVTAGHCTESPADHAMVYFQAGPMTPDPDFSFATKDCAGIDGFPCTGGITGEVFGHPLYDPDAFELHDLGVVVLDDPVVLSGYGALPALRQLNGMKPGPKSRFTAVGYGLQKAFPTAASRKDVEIFVRMVARPHLLQINTRPLGSATILVSANARTGGTCFGDSGGPLFIGNSNVIAGVISFGNNPTCAGTSGIYRIDQPDDLNWLATFLD